MTSTNHLVIAEEKTAGHHPNYLAAILAAALRLPDTAVSLLAHKSILDHQAVAPMLESPCVLSRRLDKPPGYKNFRNRYLSHSVVNFRRYRALARQVRQLEETRGKASLVFFPTIYDDAFVGFRYTRKTFCYPVGGIYMNSTWFRGGHGDKGSPHSEECPSHLRDPRVRCVALLDPWILDDVQRFTPRAIVHAVPDFVRPVEPVAPDWWPDVVAAAAGRPIVGLYGFLSRSKGLLSFRELALRYRDKALFAVAGELYEQQYSDDELHTIRTSGAEQSNAFWLREGQLRGEQEFQFCIQNSAIVYCAYEGFVNSSNVFSLATAHGRHTIIPPRGYMADEAVYYERAIVAGDFSIDALSEAVTEAIRRVEGIPQEQTRDAAACDRYSLARFEERITTLLQQSTLNGAGLHQHN